jgi:hypothetical protein
MKTSVRKCANCREKVLILNAKIGKAYRCKKCARLAKSPVQTAKSVASTK